MCLLDGASCAAIDDEQRKQDKLNQQSSPHSLKEL